MLRVFRDGQEIKRFTIQYNSSGLPAKIRVGATHTWRAAGDFEFKDEQPKVKAKISKSKK